MEKVELTEVEKQERAEAFKKELNALCEKYKCSLYVGDIMIKVD